MARSVRSIPTSARLRPHAEPTSFDVVLLSAGPGKLNVVKLVTVLTGCGLKEAKDLVDALGVVVSAVSRGDADAARAQLVAAGATVSVVPHDG